MAELVRCGLKNSETVPVDVDAKFVIVCEMDMVSAGEVVHFVAWSPGKQVEPDEKVGQSRLEAQDIGSCDEKLSLFFEDPVTLPHEMERIF
jgi:hypothetical protein